jgi:hypothetical protein
MIGPGPPGCRPCIPSAPPCLCDQLAGRGRQRERVDAGGWLEVADHDRSLHQGHGRGAGQSEPCPPVTRRPTIDLGHRDQALHRVPNDAESRSAARQRKPRCGRCPRPEVQRERILTMEPPGTAVRTAVSPGHARPSGPQLSVLFRISYGFTFGDVMPSGASRWFCTWSMPCLAPTIRPQRSLWAAHRHDPLCKRDRQPYCR